MSKKRCTATTKAGKPCRAWAVRDSYAHGGQPRCIAHRAHHDNPVVLTGPALYSRYFTDLELHDLSAWDQDAPPSVHTEIAYGRVILSRVLAGLPPDAPLSQLLHATPAIARLLRTIGYLVQTQHNAHPPEDATHPSITRALAQLGEEWNLDLLGEDQP